MEIWQDLPGSEGTYQISNLGRVKTLDRVIKCGRNIKKHIPEKVMAVRDHAGYKTVTLRINGKTKVCSIHRLVAKTFIANSNNYKCVNHIDGNKENNAVDNLEWCDYSHNIKHAYNNGLRVAKNSPKLTNSQVSDIRKLCNTSDYTLTRIAEIFGVSKSTISKIKNYKSWVE
jgi:hypothetical protein